MAEQGRELPQGAPGGLLADPARISQVGWCGCVAF